MTTTYSRFEVFGMRDLTCAYALRAELSRCKLLATCAFTRPLQAAELVRNPIGSMMRFCGTSRTRAAFTGRIARERFLSQLG